MLDVQLKLEVEHGLKALDRDALAILPTASPILKEPDDFVARADLGKWAIYHADQSEKMEAYCPSNETKRDWYVREYEPLCLDGKTGTLFGHLEADDRQSFCG